MGLSIHREKFKILKINAANTNPITLDGEALEEVEAFTYLGSVIDKQGGTDADVEAQIRKARTAFVQLRNVWSSKSQLSTPKSNSPTPTPIQSFNKEQRHGEPLLPLPRNCRFSSSAACARFSTSDGQTPLATVNSGRGQKSCLQKKKSRNDVGAGEDTPCESLQTTSPDKP